MSSSAFTLHMATEKTLDEIAREGARRMLAQALGREPKGDVNAYGATHERTNVPLRVLINESTCLPYVGDSSCRMCVDECEAAGYNAIEFRTVGTQLDDDGLPLEGTGRLVPVVLADACIGCGLCQTRCHIINVKQQHLLRKSAILITAGPGKEDRLTTGSYRTLRARPNPAPATPTDSYLPDFLQ